MRIVLVILSTTSLLFIWGVFIVLSKNGNLLTNQSTHTTLTTNSSQSQDVSLAVEALKQQIRTQEKLDALQKQLDKLTGANTTKKQEEEWVEDNKQTTTGTIIPISAKFLGKILPTIEPKKIENTGIFDLRIFDNTIYTTYQDAKFGITIVASMVPYETFIKNFKAIDKKVYTVNETKTFPFPSFYINPPKSDTTVRIVIKVEAQTLLITIPKSKFNAFKQLILKTK